MSDKSFINTYTDRINQLIQQEITNNNSTLSQAINYSLSSKGKRIRALLIYATGKTFDIPNEKLDPIATAIELVHLYACIHDDLPAMDNDELRRGQPTTHIKYNEATAILVGDALLTRAFEILSQENENPQASLYIINYLAKKIGKEGMCEGQSQDVNLKTKITSLESIKEMYQKKTSDLIEASIVTAYQLSNKPQNKIQIILAHLAQKIGLYFQIQDDILEHTSNTTILGKKTDSDHKNNKTTIIKLISYPKAIELNKKIEIDIKNTLKKITNNNTFYLENIIKHIINREF